MAGFNLGAFAGGIGSGVEQGIDIRERYQRLADAARARRAEMAAGGALQQLANQPVESLTKDPAMGGAGVGAPASLAGLQPIAVPGAQPMPGMGAPPPQAGPAPAGPMPPPQAGPAPAGPMPGPPAAPPPAAAPAPAPAPAGPPPMGGAAPPMGAPGAGAGAALAQGAKASVAMNPQAQMMTQAAQRMQQQQQTLKTLIGAVTTADPSLKSDPAAAFEAVQKLIDLNKSMDESDRTMVNAELAYLKAQTAYVLGQGRLGVAEQNADTSARRADIQASGEQSLDAYRKGILDIDNKRLAEAWDAVKLRTSSQERIAAARNATTIQAAQIRSMTQEDVANKMIEFREQALQAGLDEKTWQALLTAQLKEQGMSDAFIAKVFASQASNAGASGQPLPAPPHRNQSALPPPPGRSPAGGPAPRSGGTPPPFPPSHDGLTATSPNGENWIVRGGKWVPA